MPEPAIIRGSEHFFNVLYEGNGGGQKVGRFVPFTDNGTIAKSCLFDDGDTPYLRRTPSGAGNRDTFTWSFWVKRATLGVLQVISQQGADHNNSSGIVFTSSNQLRYAHSDSGSATDELISNTPLPLLSVQVTDWFAENAACVPVNPLELTFI